MCSVSAIVNTWTDPNSRNYVNLAELEAMIARAMLDALRTAEIADKALGAKDCAVEAKKKKAFKAKLKRKANTCKCKKGEGCLVCDPGG